MLNRHEDLYGKRIQIRYLEYIRPEIKFDSREALRLKMQEDIAGAARAWFVKRAGGREINMLRKIAEGYYKQGYNCAGGHAARNQHGLGAAAVG